jgi:hypothetical protein
VGPGERGSPLQTTKGKKMKTVLNWLGIGLVILVITIAVLLVIDQILPPGWNLTSEILLGLTAIVLSLAFNFVPILRVKFAGLTSAQKSYVNLILVTLFAIVMFLGVCAKWFAIPGIICTSLGIKTLAIYVIIAIGGNQLAYIASPQPVDVRDAKYARITG